MFIPDPDFYPSQIPRVYAQHSPLIWRGNPTKKLGFPLPSISPWFFVGSLLFPPPYAQSLLRKPSFLVLADFFPWFIKSQQLFGFLGVVYMLKQGPKRNIPLVKRPFKHVSDI